MVFLYKVITAYILDLIFGDPQRFPHPVRFIGKLVNFLEEKLINKSNGKFWGSIMNLSVLAIVYLVSLVFTLNLFTEILLIYTLFATRCLADEGNKVYKILLSGDMEKAKSELSYLVSRDTNSMDEQSIIRSTMETISENIVDGIIAPMFYLFIGGLPLAMVYKAINTMDSMVGYKNEKYRDFGWFSARLDDWANFIPARLTGLILIPAASLILRYNAFNSIRIFLRDRKNHESPNSGHPESAVAGALGVQFGGKVSYFGVIENKPVIGDKLKVFELSDIRKNIRLAYGTSFAGLILFSVIYVCIKIYFFSNF